MKVLLNTPNTNIPSGIRDRAMIYLTFVAGLRVSELVEMKLDQVVLNSEPTVHIYGKGRRERVIPLWKETANAVRAWISVRVSHETVPELFLNAQNKPMTRSGFKYILSKHIATASKELPSLTKKHVSPHVLRHTCAIHTLQATHDVRKVSLWLGHADLKTTEIYLRKAPSIKLEILTAGTPFPLKKGKFKAPDKLM